MLSRIVRTVLFVFIAACTLWAANDPFVGKWRLNPANVSMSRQILKIEDHGGRKYTITYGSLSYAIVADGTDHPELIGLTEAITLEGPNAWKRVVKKNGRVIRTAIDTVSPDGKTFTERITSVEPGGSTVEDLYVAKRIAGSNGMAGTWELTGAKIRAPEALEIQPYQGNGLSFVNRFEHFTQNMKFDGRDYLGTGPDAAAGSVSSGRRVNSRTPLASRGMVRLIKAEQSITDD
jgi:hypothetical protein